MLALSLTILFLEASAVGALRLGLAPKGNHRRRVGSVHAHSQAVQAHADEVELVTTREVELEYESENGEAEPDDDEIDT